MAEPATTQKHRSFIAEPMGRKRVSELPGIGKVLSEKLEAMGIEKAQEVYGRYLVMKENKAAFQEWMKEAIGASTKYSSDCYNGLQDWHRKHML